MSNYYKQFSTALSLPTEEAEKYATDLALRLDTASQDECTEPDDIPRELWDWIEDWNCTVILNAATATHGIVVYSEEDGNPEAVAVFLKHLIAKFTPSESKWFSWACSCSKPRIDEFGGGAAFITATHIEWLSTTTWCQEQACRHRNRQLKAATKAEGTR